MVNSHLVGCAIIVGGLNLGNLARLKEEILAAYDFAYRERDEGLKRRLELEVQIDIRDRLETLCAVERKILNESIRRNKAIKDLDETIDGLPPQDVEVEVEASP
jgi:hypothetical protein